MEIDGKLPPWLLVYGFRPVTPTHTAQSGICVRRTEPDAFSESRTTQRDAIIFTFTQERAARCALRAIS
jgi:hypothetical protein